MVCQRGAAMIKIVFFDIDGTLLHNKKVPDSAKQALQLLKDQGILPVLATGRSEYEVRALREELNIDWAITCNGAHIGHRGRTVSGTSFAPELIKEWVERTPEHHSFLLYGAEKMFSTRPECPYLAQARQEIGFLEPVRFAKAEELPEIYQCILFCPEEDTAAYTNGHEDKFHPHRWRTWAIDLNPSGINKSVGIAKLLQHLGYTPEQAAAFGDGKNDIEMLQFVGRGIAMGNACPELLATAPYRTKAVHEDGILHGVQTLVLDLKLA